MHEIKPKVHLAHLDGIRGLMAFYVVVHHIYLQNGSGSFSSINKIATNWLFYGHNAVAVFIVLSGYCLMIPVATTGEFRGSATDFYLRRAKRILPPYYVALVFSFLLIYLFPRLNVPSGTMWDSALPATGLGAIFSHIFLLHNLFSNFCFKINPPMWSIATEFQIYLLFPVLIIPIYKKWGMAVSIISGFILGLGIPFVVQKGEGASFWYIGLFTLGMAAARYNFSGYNNIKPWIFEIFILQMTMLYFALNFFAYDWFNAHHQFMDIICGAAAAIFLAYYAAIPKSSRRWLKFISYQIIENKISLKIGLFSYSLYLVHMPVVALMDAYLRPLNISQINKFYLLMILGITFSLLIAWVFYLLVERRSINQNASLTLFNRSPVNK